MKYMPINWEPSAMPLFQQTQQAADPDEAASTGSVTGYRLRGVQGRLIRSVGHAIVRGVYAPGAVLPRETELMAEHGVSPTSVREAIKVLSGKGLVETRQKVGTRVRARDHWNIFDADVLNWHMMNEVDDNVLRDLIEMRQLVEPTAARFAARRATIDDLGRIADSVEAMRGALGDIDAYAKADVDFQMAVLAASQNKLLQRFAHIIASALKVCFRIQQVAHDWPDERLEHDLELHVLIADAISRGDPAAAEEATVRAILDGNIQPDDVLSARVGKAVGPLCVTT